MATKLLNQAQHLVISSMLKADHWDGPISTEKAIWTMSIKEYVGDLLPPRVYAGTLGGLVNAGVLIFGGKGTVKDPSSVALTEAGFETIRTYGMINEQNYPTGAEWVDLTPPKKRGGRPPKAAAPAAEATPAPAAEAAPAPAPEVSEPAAAEESGEATTPAEAFEDKFFGKEAAQKARKAAKAKERRAAAKAAKAA